MDLQKTTKWENLAFVKIKQLVKEFDSMTDQEYSPDDYESRANR